MKLIVHGGAGGTVTQPAKRETILATAATAGVKSSSPTAAVCTAIRILESDPRFNAGIGGALQVDGIVRTDAGLMTDDREIGAACSMPGVEHAIDVARLVKEETPHILISGVHAVDLAAAYDIETAVELTTRQTTERWSATTEHSPTDARKQVAWVSEHFPADSRPRTDDATSQPDSPHASKKEDRDHDTVGAVATDGDSLAAATSTGGRWGAMAGRVGDVPQVGAGFYCTPHGGVSATGTGEDIARLMLARNAVQLLADGHDAQTAAEKTINEFTHQCDTSAGVILLTPTGDTGHADTTDAMQTHIATDTE